jgi:hypothetical protein
MTVGRGGGTSGADLAERLIRLRNSIDVLELEFSRVAGDFAETDEYDEQGFVSPASWIKANCHLSGGAAWDRIYAGRQLERLGENRAALGMGEISFAHFALIARASASVAIASTRPSCCSVRARSVSLAFARIATPPATRPTPRTAPPRKLKAWRRGASRSPTTTRAWSS